MKNDGNYKRPTYSKEELAEFGITELVHVEPSEDFVLYLDWINQKYGYPEEDREQKNSNEDNLYKPK
jgi:hypothetical protein